MATVGVKAGKSVFNMYRIYSQFAEDECDLISEVLSDLFPCMTLV